VGLRAGLDGCGIFAASTFPLLHLHLVSLDFCISTRYWATWLLPFNFQPPGPRRQR